MHACAGSGCAGGRSQPARERGQGIAIAATLNPKGSAPKGLTGDQPGGEVAHIHLALRLAGSGHSRQRLLLQHQLPRAQLLLLHLPRDCRQHGRWAMAVSS